MVFGLSKLQDELFCVTEERDYFQTKYMEQISEITALKEDLLKAKREITRLREQLMVSSQSQLQVDDDAPSTSPSSRRRQRRSYNNSANNSQNGIDDGVEVEAHDDDADHNEEEDHHDEDDHEEEEDEEDQERKEIRQSAEKLLQWASYRTSYTQRQSSLSPSSSIASPKNLAIELPDKDDGEEKKDDSAIVPRDIHTKSPTSPTFNDNVSLLKHSTSQDSEDTLPTSHPSSPPDTPSHNQRQLDDVEISNNPLPTTVTTTTSS